MRFGSVCSGIEAASVAWTPLGWKASWLAEIEPAPCSTLAHHYPNTLNFGDMTQFESWPDDEHYAIDLLCGGTPCQSFSVAGLRKGLDDDRGNLMLTFAAIAAKYRPKWLVWENVPGVLSSNSGRDFASFLGLLSGQVIEPPADGWSNSGIITGYQNAYSLAWRVLDAQYFGLAQRRKRVFVVGCLGANRSGAAVLFERNSLSGDTAPSRKKRQSLAGCLTSGAFSGGASGRPEGAAGNHFIPTVIDRAAFNQGANALYEPLIEESETMPTIVARGPHAVLQSAARMVAFGEYVDDGTASTMKQRDYKDATDLVTYAFDSLSSNSMKSSNPNNGCNVVDIAKTIDTTRPDPSKNQGGNAILQPMVVHGTQDPCVSDIAFSQGRNNGGENVLLQPIAWSEELTASIDCASTTQRGGQGGRHEGVMTQTFQVRRLTPRECERLQGFQWRVTPDYPGAWEDLEGRWWSPDYTNIPHRGKPAADGNRYKALGNSWAVPCARWIGERIQMVEDLSGGTPC